MGGITVDKRIVIGLIILAVVLFAGCINNQEKEDKYKDTFVYVLHNNYQTNNISIVSYAPLEDSWFDVHYTINGTAYRSDINYDTLKINNTVGE